MALAFLNKKGFHTSTLRNVERVWKAEQRHEQEQKKIADLQREKEEERQILELRDLQQKAKGQDKSERLDWLYEGPMKWQQPSSEEFLLGKPIPDTKDDTQQLGEAPGSLFLNKGLNATQDAMAKVMDDPMLEIRKAEKQALELIRKNPVKMALLKQEAKKLKEKELKKKQKKKGKEKERDKDGKSSKKKHKKKHRRSPTTSSDSESESKSESESRKRRRKTEAAEREDEELPRKAAKAERERERERGRGGERERDREAEGELDRERERERGGKRPQEREGEMERDRSSRSEASRGDGERTRGGAATSERIVGRSRRDEAEGSDDESRRHLRTYGLVIPKGSAPVKKPTDTAEWERIEKERKRKEEEKARELREIKERMRKPMTEEERQQKLREMMDDGAVHDDARWERLRRDKVKDAIEKTKEATAVKDARFLKDVNQSVYSNEHNSTVEDRVRRNAWYQQRGGMDSSFARR